MRRRICSLPQQFQEISFLGTQFPGIPKNLEKINNFGSFSDLSNVLNNKCTVHTYKYYFQLFIFYDRSCSIYQDTHIDKIRFDLIDFRALYYALEQGYPD